MKQRPIYFSTFAGRALPMLALLIAALLVSASLSIAAPTTAPTAGAAATATPPAIPGAYDNDLLRHSDSSSVTATGGKSPTSVQNPYAAPLDMRRVAWALAIVLGLVFTCRWAARWMFPSVGVGRSSQVMKVLSRSVIAPKQQLILVQVGRRLVVVADSGQQMSALTEITDPDEVASLLGQLRAEPEPTERNKSFDPMLGSAIGSARRQFEGLQVPPAMDSDDDDEAEYAGVGADSSPVVDETRSDLSGLTEKIRMLSKQIGKM